MGIIDGRAVVYLIKEEELYRSDMDLQRHTNEKELKTTKAIGRWSRLWVEATREFDVTLPVRPPSAWYEDWALFEAEIVRQLDDGQDEIYKVFGWEVDPWAGC